MAAKSASKPKTPRAGATARYTIRPPEVEAVRWTKHGQDDRVAPVPPGTIKARHICEAEAEDCGWIPTAGLVRPGDYIVTDPANPENIRVVDPDAFAATYQPAAE